MLIVIHCLNDRTRECITVTARMYRVFHMFIGDGFLILDLFVWTGGHDNQTGLMTALPSSARLRAEP
jgi:hypothetical protein